MAGVMWTTAAHLHPQPLNPQTLKDDKVRDFGLLLSVFPWGYWCMEFRLGFFYGGRLARARSGVASSYGSSGGSIIWVLLWVFW